MIKRPVAKVLPTDGRVPKMSSSQKKPPTILCILGITLTLIAELIDLFISLCMTFFVSPSIEVT